VTDPDPQTLTPVLIVSGTGTEVGKTVVTAAIAALAADRASVSRWSSPRKPANRPGPPGICRPPPGSADRQPPVRLTQTHELARFAHPLSPEAAARAAGRPALDLAAAAVAIKELEADLILIEGAGGLLVRYDPSGRTIADLAVLPGQCG
jgi:dethiobiotin synthetase